MDNATPQLYTAFEGQKILIQGSLDEVVLKVRQRTKSDSEVSILVFSDLTGKQMDFDLRGTEKEVLQRLQIYLPPEEKSYSGPGRPKLGVIAREVSLLPRHWEWLSTQSGGASATLRRLVDEAKKSSSGRELLKQAQERAYKFMTTMAGDLPHYEDAIRALYAKDKKKFNMLISQWPTDIKEHTKALASDVFE